MSNNKIILYGVIPVFSAIIGIGLLLGNHGIAADAGLVILGAAVILVGLALLMNWRDCVDRIVQTDRQKPVPPMTAWLRPFNYRFFGLVLVVIGLTAVLSGVSLI